MSIQHELFEDVGRRTEFAKVFGELEIAFARKPSPARVMAYWKYLHPLPPDLLGRAARVFILDVGRFPSIADWRKQVEKLEKQRGRKRGQFQRVEGIYCEDCEDTGWRFLAGNEDVNGSPITVAERRRMEHEERGRGWVFRTQACPCRDENPNFQCAQDERTDRPPDIDRDKAAQLARKYLPRAAGRW